MRALKYLILLLTTILCLSIMFLNNNETLDNPTREPLTSESEVYENYKKGYDLPIDENEKEIAREDSLNIMEKIRNIYISAEKGTSENTVLPDETLLEMQTILKDTQTPVTTTIMYSNMDNYEEMIFYLKSSEEGLANSVLMYTICSDGGLTRRKFNFDGSEMYVLCTNARWNEENEPIITDTSYTRIEEWNYTENGWFCYKLCVPEYPEVTEIIDGSCMFRVLPLSDTNRNMTEKYVLPLGYKGNNILCSNWDGNNLEYLDYSGMYEYLYEMKYQHTFPYERYLNGIPKEDFENLITEFFPIEKKQLQQYAAFDEATHMYKWSKLGCGTFNRSFFSTAFPEVVNVQTNNDGTIILTVNAVCEMMLCNDAVITHELTIKLSEDGSFQYLSNKILDNGIEDLPTYTYRVSQNIE